jgi:ribosomal protein S18 acetylase RimI-like enzyme
MARPRIVASHCRQPPIERDLDLALLVERHHAECFVAEGSVPGTEIHEDPDVTWLVHSGATWRNAGIMVRLSETTANRRLGTLVARYQKHGRGMALWISPCATPENLSEVLKARGLRCQKYFPAMVRHLAASTPVRSLPEGVDIRVLEDVEEFTKTPHPAIGPLTTPLRRAALQRVEALISDRQRRTVAHVAWLDGTPVGSSELFLGTDCAGIHSLTVPDEYRGRGIGTALVEHACKAASRLGASKVVLLASSDGQPLYQRCGFIEVARFGYWYRSFQRC